MSDHSDGIPDRCEIGAIEALREDDTFDLQLAKLSKRKKHRGRRRVKAVKYADYVHYDCFSEIEYSTEPCNVPDWQTDKNKLPKKPPKKCF